MELYVSEMEFVLSEDDYAFLKKNTEDYFDEIICNVSTSEGKTKFYAKDIDKLQLCISDAVFLYGMDDEYGATDIGKRLYNIYDELLYQRGMAEKAQ